MATPSITYTFANATTIVHSEVNQNFTDLVNSLTDGNDDLTINALTLNGDATLNGAVTLGNASGDDITFSGRVASDIDPKTAGANTLGDATQTWRALYLDNTSTDGGAIYFNASSSAFLKSDASGTDLDLGGFTGFDLGAGSRIKTFGTETSAKSANYTITDTDGVGTVLMTTGASAKTVTLPTPGDNTGRIITVKKVDSAAGVLNLAEDGSETIDGYSSVVAPLQYDFITVQSDGSMWHIVNRRHITPWIAYSPTIAGLGTPTTDTYYRRNGGAIDIYGKVTAGTTAASELQIGIPSGLTLGGIASQQTIYGEFHQDSTQAFEVNWLRGLRGETYFTVEPQIDGASNNVLTATGRDGSNRVANSGVIILRLSAIPIQEFEDTL